MTAPVCTSKWQCQLNGLSGTAVTISALLLIWVGWMTLAAGLHQIGTVLWLWAVPFGPVTLSVLYVAIMQAQARPVTGFGLVFTLGGAVWGVVMLNTLRHL